MACYDLTEDTNEYHNQDDAAVVHDDMVDSNDAMTRVGSNIIK